MIPVARDEIVMRKNIREAQANSQVAYIFDENTNEHFGSVQQSPIIIDRDDANSNRTNKGQLRASNNIQHQVSIVSMAFC
jgi:hypothetical protein